MAGGGGMEEREERGKGEMERERRVISAIIIIAKCLLLPRVEDLVLLGDIGGGLRLLPLE